MTWNRRKCKKYMYDLSICEPNWNTVSIIFKSYIRTYPWFELLPLLKLRTDDGVDLLELLGFLNDVFAKGTWTLLRISFFSSKTLYWPGPGVASLLSLNRSAFKDKATPAPVPFPLMFFGSYIFGPGVSVSFSLNLLIGALANDILLKETSVIFVIWRLFRFKF